jgi:hypothetical protein
LKIHGKGTTISVGGNLIGEMKSIGGLEITRAMHDVTTHDSADNFTEKLGGLLSVGDVPVTGLFDTEDSDGQHALLTAIQSSSYHACVITLPAVAGTSWSFNAWISAVKIGDANDDGEVPFSFTLAVTGKPTLNITESAGLTTPFFAISESAVIVPSPANDVYEYVANVLTGVTSVTLTPTATAGEIKVNDNVVATGEASSAITLGDAGSMTDITVVVKETNKVPVTYVIHVIRAAS